MHFGKVTLERTNERKKERERERKKERKEERKKEERKEERKKIILDRIKKSFKFRMPIRFRTFV